MHSTIFSVALLSSLAAAAPAKAPAATAAYPSPTVTCPSGLVPMLAHYEDLPAATGRAHAINPDKNGNGGVYKNLYYGNINWFLTSNGPQVIPWGPTGVQAQGTMYAASGNNAIVNQEDVPLRISTMYDGDYINLDSLNVRSLDGSAFTMEIRCSVYNGQGSTTAQEIDVAIPASNNAVNNGYTKIQLTTAQKALIAKSHDCLLGDKNQRTYTLIDDFQYCYYHNPTKPF